MNLPEHDLLVDCAQGFVRGWTESKVREAIAAAVTEAYEAGRRGDEFPHAHQAWTTPLAVRESESPPKRCEACRSKGLLHCSDPANCGGPWDEHVEATGAQS